MMWPAIHVFDAVLENAPAYRAAALAQPFRDVETPAGIFSGMAACADPAVPTEIATRLPGFCGRFSCFRRSPAGQPEPHYIHTDVDMGDWTAVLYLHPHPPEGDGTSFWRDRHTQAIAADHSTPAMWANREAFDRWHHVPAVFNRLVVFPAPYFHSRGLIENYGQGHDARLIQIVFGTKES